MKKKVLLTLFISFVYLNNVKSQIELFPKDKSYDFVTDSLHIHPKRPWVAAGTTVASNIVVWSFNKYVNQAPFANINWETISRNLKTLPAWDKDPFSTNLFGHPYQGSLYFNSARSNGLNFWQSAPYALGGSLMWEYFMETEWPSLNDLYTTTIGGIMLGELTFRLSDLVIDDRSTGWGRFGREVAVCLLAPTRGFTRLVNGDAWKHRSYKGRSLPTHPVMMSVGVGYRYLAQDNAYGYGNQGGLVNLRFRYGDPFEGDDSTPFDWFQLKTTFNISNQQPMLGSIEAVASLWDKPIYEKNGHRLLFGAFQHFSYYDSEPTRKEIEQVPYRIAEAASFGVGLLYQTKPTPKGTRFGCELFTNGVILGASYTDYYRESVGRDYNMGSGYSGKLTADLTVNKKWHFILSSSRFHIFTWKGENPNLPLGPENENTFRNMQGDVGATHLSVINSSISYTFWDRYTLSGSHEYYIRQSNYKYYDNVSYRTFDSRIMLSIRI